MGSGPLVNSIDLRTGQSGGVSFIILQCEGETNGMIGRRAGGLVQPFYMLFLFCTQHSLFPGFYLPVHVLSYFRPLKGVGLKSYFLPLLFHLPAGSLRFPLLFCH